MADQIREKRINSELILLSDYIDSGLCVINHSAI